MVQLTRIQALFCQLRCLIFCCQSIDLANAKFKVAFVICCDKYIQVHYLPLFKGSFGDPCPKFPIGFMIPWLNLEVWITTNAINAVWKEFPVGIGGRSTQTVWAVVGVCHKVTSCKKERKTYYLSIPITIQLNILIRLYIVLHLYHHWRPWCSNYRTMHGPTGLQPKNPPKKCIVQSRTRRFLQIAVSMYFLYVRKYNR